MSAPDLVVGAGLRVPDLGTVLGVWAHPDDETYLSGGLQASAAAAGQRVVCVTATHACGPRTDELAAALAILGVGEHVRLGYVDGECAAVEPTEGAARIAEVIRAVRRTRCSPLARTGSPAIRTTGPSPPGRWTRWPMLPRPPGCCSPS